MSNRLFQNVLHQMRDVIGRTVGVIDENGIIVACSDIAKIGESRQRIREELSYSGDVVVYEHYTYRFLTSQNKLNSIVFVEGDDAEADKAAKMLSITLGSVKSLYDEKYDKGSFIKNIILDNILPNDIYIKSNELHMTNDGLRAVMVVKFQGGTDIPPYEVVQNLVDENGKDYVINISEQDIVIVKEIDEECDEDALEKEALELIKKAASEHGARAIRQKGKNTLKHRHHFSIV